MSRELVDLVVRAKYVFTMNPRREIITDGAIAICRDRIVSVGKKSEVEGRYRGEKVLDYGRAAALPGFVDAHTHNAQTLLRGVITDYEISIPPVWLRYLIPYESLLKPEDVKLIATLTQLNMIEHGVTTFLEAGGPYPEKIAEAVAETGVRGVVTMSTVDMGNVPEAMKISTESAIKKTIGLIENWHGKAGGRIRVWFSLRQMILCTQELYFKFKELARKYNVGITTHVSEAHVEIEYSLEKFKKRPIERLYEIGFLGSNVVLAHAAFLTPKEVKLIAETGANVAYCPSIDHMLMSPPRVPEMLNLGVNVALGSDGGFKTGIDILGEARLASIVIKQYYGFPFHDRTGIPAEKFLEMATINGAKALMWDREIGSIEPGKKADIIVIDLSKPHTTPVNNPATTLIYCANAGDVVTTIVDGKILMENKKHTYRNVYEVVEKALERTEELMEEIRRSWRK
ncbi:MAG: hypothetical protein DRO23_09385 [Thermoprotei archaeon]|nr:MAG: hypothetical protein DRO23_09385 [Thermoprotei archaeon]